MPASNPPGTASIKTEHLAPQAVTLEKVAGDVLPAGSVQQFAGASAPSGWLFCQGQEVSQTTYSALYAALGTTYNTGSETVGNFRLPDLRGRVPVGPDGGVGRVTANNALGNASGNQAHTHTCPAHYHGKGNLGISDPGHSHTTNLLQDDCPGCNPNSSKGLAPQHDFQSSQGHGSSSNTTGISLSGTYVGNGGGVSGDSAMTSGSTSTMQPYIILNYIIKT